MTTDARTTQGIVLNIQSYTLHDGPGIRTTVFLKGCPLRCWWCHNPESQQLKPEKHSRFCRMGDQTFQREETVGKQMSAREVLSIVERDRLFYDQSGGGVTFSGGEPLMQIHFLEALLRAAREREIHTCLDTSGFTTPDKFKGILPWVDLFLYDLKLLDEEQHVRYTGVSNRSILQNLTTLIQAGKPVIIRFPVVPTITDTEQNLTLLRKWMERYGADIQRLDLLPYHDIARGKYQRLEKEDKMPGINEPGRGYIQQIRSALAETGVTVTVGG